MLQKCKAHHILACRALCAVDANEVHKARNGTEMNMKGQKSFCEWSMSTSGGKSLWCGRFGAQVPGNDCGKGPKLEPLCVSIHCPHLTNLLHLVGHWTGFGPMPCPQPANLSSRRLLDGNLHYQWYWGAHGSSLWTSGLLGSNTSLLAAWSSCSGTDGKGSLVLIHWDVLPGYSCLCIHLQLRMDHRGHGMGSTWYGRLSISQTYSSVSWKHSKSMKKLNWPTPLLRRLKES